MKIATHNQSEQPIARKLGYVAIGTAAILMVPLLAMQFTTEVSWTLSDFLLMGTLLMTIGSIYVLAARLVKPGQNRVLLGTAFAMLFFFIWAELAVGLIGSPFAGS